MTPQLKEYLNKHKNVIEAEQFHTLVNLAPINLKEELILFLLECTNNDASIIPTGKQTQVFEEAVRKVFPNINICHTWISLDHSGNRNKTNKQSGYVKFIATVDGKLSTGRCSWVLNRQRCNAVDIACAIGDELAHEIMENVE